MIKTIALIVVAASFAPTHVAITPNTDASISSANATIISSLVPRSAWAPQDAADSLYRAARDAFSKSDWNRSAELFNRLVEKYPSSTYAGESLYYYAFSMYRAGGTDKLKSARQALVRLNTNYPDVAR